LVSPFPVGNAVPFPRVTSPLKPPPPRLDCPRWLALRSKLELPEPLKAPPSPVVAAGSSASRLAARSMVPACAGDLPYRSDGSVIVYCILSFGKDAGTVKRGGCIVPPPCGESFVPPFPETFPNLPLQGTFRFPLMLCHIEDLSTRDAARFLGITEGALRKRLHDGKKKLQERIVKMA
jgi:hypothetical protein